MCIAVPGKVVSLEGNFARVDFRGNIVKVNTGLVEAGVGDYVLVHAGCAIEVMSGDMANELAGLFDELEEYGNIWN
ncbi:MAG: HypC/HybG/HupF family hydrogenase formation chaperone [Clostridiales bacterium]|nr:HypC/HybG/HupF family hydrogenase formation chaperone [Clostridiales bacterium]